MPSALPSGVSPDLHTTTLVFLGEPPLPMLAMQFG